MATQQLVHSVSLLDAKGERRSIPLYFTYDSAATLSAILAYCAVTLLDLDAITEAQIVKQSITLDIALPSSGIKTAPIANSDVEETGLFTYLTTAPVKRSFGQDIPAFLQSLFTGPTIDLSAGAVSTWTGRFIATGGTLVGANQDFLAGLASIRKGVKSFRKSRRALERA
jgi:hypothetical protein